MNALDQELNNNLLIWDSFGLECFKEYPTRNPEEPYRAYLCSQSLGGTLAVYADGGWIPTYPEKPNYPMEGRWFSPSPRIYKPREWYIAVIHALSPDPKLFIDKLSRRTAINRAAMLRDAFRAQVMIGAIKARIPEASRAF